MAVSMAPLTICRHWEARINSGRWDEDVMFIVI
jgi:hypothetical protein